MSKNEVEMMMHELKQIECRCKRFIHFAQTNKRNGKRLFQNVDKYKF